MSEPTARGASSTVDCDARERIERSGLHETLFVEAGAGTGKTHELVERVINLVVHAGIPLSAVAAITFTEAAAAELRDRIREALERRLAEASTGLDERATCDRALAELDEAAISTLHGFALRILNEHPLEIHLPPRVEVLDEVSSQLAFEERWQRFVDELYADPAAEELVLRTWVLGLEIDTGRRRSRVGKVSLKDVASNFEANWDRIDPEADADHPPLSPIDLTPLADAVAELQIVAKGCSSDGDKLLGQITDKVLPEALAALAEPDPMRGLSLVKDHHERWKSGRRGVRTNWDDVVAARASVDGVGVAGGEVCQRLTDQVLRQLSTRLARFTHDAADARRAEGQLDFHDLLVLARRLVQRSPSARSSLHHRYERLLLDEFQDTDPIQIEVAVLIATAVVDGTIDRPWTEVTTEAGRLFLVGDPKQSIYRFRRADIGLFLEARDALGGTSPVTLSQNFRTVAPILAWVNHVFDQLMPVEVKDAQARYQPLTAFRTDAPADHRVVLLGGMLDLNAGELRDAEAAAVAGAVVSVRDDPGAWLVQDEADGRWRAPRMADVTILVPTRTSLRQLEDALDSEHIPYRVATGTLIYDTQEVREVLDALRAIDDPNDRVALVSALRSPLYACSDVDLLTYRQAGGRWDLRAAPPAGLGEDHPVAQAIAGLRSLWEVRWWHEPSALLDRLLRERQAFALAFSHRRPREVWRRLRFLVDQARAFSEAGGGGLRAFLDWAELQRSEGSRVHEPLLAETDDDAVSILTIHGAKGLEFPITILSGATTQASARRNGLRVLWDGDRPELRLRKGATTDNFDRLADIEAEMDEYERARLLYVACTRARDHLVVSTFHHLKANPSYGGWLARCSADVEETLCRRLPERQPGLPGEATVPTQPDIHVGDGREAWCADRNALLAAQRRPRFLSATTIAETAAEAEDPAADEDRPGIAWRRGRAGSAIGRAVHATLQFLGGEEGRLDELAAQQSRLEAVPEAAEIVAAMARSALLAPSVKASSDAARSWRELYVAAPVGDRAIEGYIDLLYETAEGLVLVDYKTDTVGSTADVDAKVARYGLQAAAYAVALETSTGLTVAAAYLVFCTTGAPIERAVPDLDAAKEEVRRRVDEAPERRPD